MEALDDVDILSRWKVPGHSRDLMEWKDWDDVEWQAQIAAGKQIMSDYELLQSIVIFIRKLGELVRSGHII